MGHLVNEHLSQPQVHHVEDVLSLVHTHQEVLRLDIPENRFDDVLD